MGGLPTTKRFYAEDYKDAPPWFHRFLSQLDLYTEPVYNILNQNVDLTVNTNEELYSLEVKSAHAMGADNNLFFVPKKFIGRPNGVIVAQCLVDGQTASVSSVTLAWVWTGSQVNIKAIYGLAEGRNHVVTLRIF